MAKTFPGFWDVLDELRSPDPAGRVRTRVTTPDAPDRPLTVIAIDGPAGSGKSTVGRRLAGALGLEYLDTGAMYRAVTFAALRRGIDPADADVGRPPGRAGRARASTTARVIVDGVDATIEIRGPEVTRAVSIVAANPGGPRASWCAASASGPSQHGGGVIEGRDIGTVVFPDAALKVYLDRLARGPGRAPVQGGHRPRLRDRRRRPRPPRRRSTRAATTARCAQADGALVIDTSDRDVDEIVADLVARIAVTCTGRRRPSEHARAGTRGELALLRRRPGASCSGLARSGSGCRPAGKEHVPAEGRVHPRPGAPLEPRLPPGPDLHQAPHALPGPKLCGTPTSKWCC